MEKKKKRNERKAGIDASREKKRGGKGEERQGERDIEYVFSFLFFFASRPLLSSPPHTRILIFRNSSRDGRTSARSAPAIRAARRGEEKEGSGEGRSGARTTHGRGVGRLRASERAERDILDASESALFVRAFKAETKRDACVSKLLYSPRSPSSGPQFR